jgi:hypothetical protein
MPPETRIAILQYVINLRSAPVFLISGATLLFDANRLAASWTGTGAWQTDFAM